MADEEKKSSKSSMPFIVGLVVVTLVAAGGGVGLSMLSPASEDGDHGPEVSSHSTEKKETDGKPAKEGQQVSVLVPMKPIITNIGKESKTLIRIESILVMKAEHSDKSDYMADKISEDILVYLRSISLRDIEGALGLLNLMEDLNIRAAARSEQKVSEVLIQSLVVER